jgi:hypothetical protein
VETVRSVEKNLRGQTDQEAQRIVLAAPFDSIVVVKRPGGPGPELALLLNKYRTKRGVQFGAALGSGHLVRLGARDLLLATGVTVTGVPRGWRQATENFSYMQLQRVDWDTRRWEKWCSDAGVDLENFGPLEHAPPALQRARAQCASAETTARAEPCYQCRHLSTCRAAEAEANKLQRALATLDAQIDAIQSRFWNQFVALRTVLERGDFLRQRELLPRGVALANLRTANELVAAEAMAAGLLENLDPGELAAVTSAIVAEPVRGRMAWRPIRPSPRVVQVTDSIIGLAEQLFKLQDQVPGVEQPITVVTDYCGMVQAWAMEANWAHVTEMSGIDEGQLVRHLRQVIDMLSQFKDVPGQSPNFVERTQSAIAALDRDIVREVF